MFCSVSHLIPTFCVLGIYGHSGSEPQPAGVLSICLLQDWLQCPWLQIEFRFKCTIPSCETQTYGTYNLLKTYWLFCLYLLPASTFLSLAHSFRIPPDGCLALAVVICGCVIGCVVFVLCLQMKLSHVFWGKWSIFKHRGSDSTPLSLSP